MAVVVAACILAGVLATTIFEERRYGPIRSGAFGGTYSAHNLVVGSDGSPSRLVGGPDASTQLLASLTNDGSHPVKITKIDTDGVVTDVRWSDLRTVPGGLSSGLDTPWRDFPAVIPAHTTIRLLLTIHRPNYCQSAQIEVGTVFYSGSYRVRWKSLLRSHVTGLDARIADIQLC